MKNKMKFLLIPAGVFLLVGCSSNKKTDISGDNGIVDNNNSDGIKVRKRLTITETKLIPKSVKKV